MNAPANRNKEDELKIVDAKLPLSWLIGCAAAIVFSMGGVFVKLDSLVGSLAKIEARTDNRDERIGALTQSLLIQQGRNETQDAHLARMQSDISDQKAAIEEVKKNQRWMPK